MIKTLDSLKLLVKCGLLGIILMSGLASATEIYHPDLPPPTQVNHALNEHLLVLNATSAVKIEQANQRRLRIGSYEFKLRVGAAHRNISNSGKIKKEWYVGLERPLRLFNKAAIDEDIGAAGVAHAQYALGNARHKAGRILLKLWFVWQRKQTQSILWRQQVTILKQQVQMAVKRVKAGEAPKLELNLALAAAAQAGVSWDQAQLRAQLAANKLARSFPAIQLPTQPILPPPIPISHDFAFWKSRILEDNHLIGMTRVQSQVKKLQARRSRADQTPDPTIGLLFSNEQAGNEKVSSVYLSMPIPNGHRSATADRAEQQAIMAANQELFIKRRLEGEIYATHLQAVKKFKTWQQAHQATFSINRNTQLIGKAYIMGEYSLLDSLTARRFALQSSIAENLALLDANEARYRLLLDAHLLWANDRTHSP
ncbi:MAG: TolC family protein [Gallionella sp.]